MRCPTVCLLTVAIGAILASPSWGGDADGPAETRSDWEYKIGVGAVVGPDYEGSRHYEVGALPLAEVSWRNAISLGTRDGLKIVVKPLKDRNFSLTGGIGYWRGRKEGADKDHGDALRGLGNLSGGAVARLGFGYQVNAASIGLDLARDLGNDRDGTTITAKLGYLIYRGNAFRLAGELSTSWADDNYMQNMFGVTQAQSIASLKHYSVYKAQAGLRDVKAGLKSSYGITPSVSVFGMVEVARLLNDAADNPIVRTQGSTLQVGGGMGVTYRF